MSQSCTNARAPIENSTKRKTKNCPPFEMSCVTWVCWSCQRSRSGGGEQVDEVWRVQTLLFCEQKSREEMQLGQPIQPEDPCESQAPPWQSRSQNCLAQPGRISIHPRDDTSLSFFSFLGMRYFGPGYLGCIISNEVSTLVTAATSKLFSRRPRMVGSFPGPCSPAVVPTQDSGA